MFLKLNMKTFNKKPEKLWEWREYKKGCLIENGIALNETATFIWKCCDGIKTINDIVSEVAKHYKIKREKAKKDVLKLIKILLKEKALRLK